MQLVLDKNGPFPLKEQIKTQIRAAINSGQFQAGQAMPSAKDLAALLEVNRNTTALAYRELAAEGFLQAVRGAGTFVKEGIKQSDLQPLKDLIAQAVSRAGELGYSSQQIAEAFQERLSQRQSLDASTVLVVWCNDQSLSEVSRALEAGLGVRTRTAWVTELQQNPEAAARYFRGVDLVVTSVNYLKTVTPLAQVYGVEVLGIMLTSMTRIINELAALEPGATLGVSCVNQMASESTERMVRLSSGNNLKTIWAGADDTQRLKEMLAQCRVVLATSYVYQRVRRLAGPDQKIINLKVRFTAAHMEMVKERLEQISNNRMTA
jgi:GntR family transcriptional regulator